MCSRRDFLQGTVGGGLGGLSLASRPAFAGACPPAQTPPDGVVFETVRTDCLAHLSYLIGDRSSRPAARACSPSSEGSPRPSSMNPG